VTGVDRISLDQFLNGLELLGEQHGKHYAVFTNQAIQDIWFKFFSRYSKEQWMRVIEHYLAHSSWFPKAPHEIQKLWDESGEEQRLAHQNLAILPAAKEQEFTPEQIVENSKKLKLACKLLVIKGVKIPPLHKTSVTELEAILEGCKKSQMKVVVLDKNDKLQTPANALFQDIRAYFFSGSERYRQMAIDWASDPTSGCELVYKNGRVIDIKEVEF
jgi:hypothetical protein